jgi:tRNA(Ile)-lysidine synthetase-like protein
MARRAAGEAELATRAAVRRALADLPAGARVLVACSGGPDSLALTAATGWVGPRAGLDVAAVVVDHGLQEGSAQVADAAVAACTVLGVPAQVVRVTVGSAGGPEAAAREARYAALTEAAATQAAAAVLLGHTLEDQAETVLLRLARGSGARSLSAMASRSGLWRRPFLDVPRATVRAAAVALADRGVVAWQDPHNDDRGFARVRVRSLLDDLVRDLGPGVVTGLARSADLLRDDADALDALAAAAVAEVVRADEDCRWVAVPDLAALPAAIRTRVIRSMALACGSPADGLGVDHVRTVEAYVVDWHGQGPTRLPGGVRAERACGRLCLRSPNGDDGGATTGGAGGA